MRLLIPLRAPLFAHGRGRQAAGGSERDGSGGTRDWAVGEAVTGELVSPGKGRGRTSTPVHSSRPGGHSHPRGAAARACCAATASERPVISPQWEPITWYHG